jgi:hypothetical protein
MSATRAAALWCTLEWIHQMPAWQTCCPSLATASSSRPTGKQAWCSACQRCAQASDFRHLKSAPSYRSDVGVIMGREWDISVKSKDITTFVEVGSARPALAVLPETVASLAKACTFATWRLTIDDRHQTAQHQPSAMQPMACLAGRPAVALSLAPGHSAAAPTEMPCCAEHRSAWHAGIVLCQHQHRPGASSIMHGWLLGTDTLLPPPGAGAAAARKRGQQPVCSGRVDRPHRGQAVQQGQGEAAAGQVQLAPLHAWQPAAGQQGWKLAQRSALAVQHTLPRCTPLHCSSS